MPDISVQLGPTTLKNPVLTASGTCGYGKEYAPYFDLSMLGGFTTKSVTVHPRKGNQPQRIVETPGGMLNAIGLANVGLDEFLNVKAAEAAQLGTRVFVNVAGYQIDDYLKVCDAVDGLPGIDGVELNVSCPNVSDGLTFGTDAPLLKELVTAARQVVESGALIVKLSPNVTDITTTARAAIEGGADALSMVNTFVGMKIDIRTRKCVLANRTGGLSGPAIRPLAIQLVNRVYTQVAHAPRACRSLAWAGYKHGKTRSSLYWQVRRLSSIGTALFVNPDTPVRVVEGMTQYLEDAGMDEIGKLVGATL